MSASRTRSVQEKRLNHLQPAAQSRSRRVPLHVVMVAFPGAALLDVTGPISIFTSAARGLQERQDVSVTAYTCEIVAPEKGPLQTAGGVQIVADRSFHQLRGSIDTLLVAGGPTVEVVVQNRELIAWLRRIAPRVRRVGSVCTGSFLLAEAGLLDGRRATTHWASGATFAKRYPQVTLDLDPMFVRDGNIYTSAG